MNKQGSVMSRHVPRGQCDPKSHIIVAAFGCSTAAKGTYRTLKYRFEQRFKQNVSMGYTSRVGNPKLVTILKRLVGEGARRVVIVPLIMIPGEVMSRDIVALADKFRPYFERLSVADPLLPDFRVFHVMGTELMRELDRDALTCSGVLLAGHGTRDERAHEIYEESGRQARYALPASIPVEFGYAEYSPPSIKDAVVRLVLADVRKIVVQPFTIVDGLHVQEVKRGLNCIGSPAGSWHRELTEMYGTSFGDKFSLLRVTFMPALGSYEGIFEIFADHAIRALRADG